MNIKSWAESSSELFWSPVVRRLSVRPSVCKLFTFSSSFPEPLSQFQPNLAESILGSRGFKFVQMKGPALFQGEIVMKKRKYNDEIKKSSPEPLSQFQPILAQIILRWRGFKFVLMKGPALFQGEIVMSSKHTLTKLKNPILQNHCANINQTWHKASLGEGDSSLCKWRTNKFS